MGGSPQKTSLNSAIFLAAELPHTAVVELTLSIDVTEGPPCGEIAAHGGRPVSFVGWLELLRCLSDLVEPVRGEAAAASSLDGGLDPAS
jgi:hypothetical protein